MRSFDTVSEAHDEVKRDLAEMGISKGESKYVLNYEYSVLAPDFTEVPNVHEAFVETEWKDRVIGDLNPGRAWRKRKDVWEQYLERDLGGGRTRKRARFSFTVGQRMGGKPLQTLISDVMTTPLSDELYLQVWEPIDSRRRETRRVPTDIGYWFKVRKGALCMTYFSRCTDFVVHFPNDVALAIMTQWYIAQKADLKVGTMNHYLCKLWADKEALEDVF